MAKEGGKAKGRPRKGIDLGTQSLPEATPMSVTSTEGTGAAETNVTVNLHGVQAELNGTVEALKKKIELEINSSVTKQSEDLRDAREKEAKALRIEEGEILPMRNRGMALGYVAPMIKKGIPTAKLCMTEIEKETAKWKNALILYVIGDTPTISYLKFFFQKQCGIMGNIEIFYHNEGCFMVLFELKTERDRMLDDGPYTIANKPIIIKEWVADFCFEKEVLREIPLWIRLPKLPLSCWSGDSLSRIGSVIGKPICADECTSQQGRISYARLLVEVDITKPLVYKVQIEGENGMMMEQQVFYEWVPIFCQQCHVVGHICKEKKKEAGIPQPPKQKQWQMKDKGKEKVVEVDKPAEAWSKPKRPTATSIQVGHLEIPTGNVFQELGESSGREQGGDLFPCSEI